MGYDRSTATEAIRVNGYVESAIDWLNKKARSEIGYSLGGSGVLGTGSGENVVGGSGGNTLGSSGGNEGNMMTEDIPYIPPEDDVVEQPKPQLTPEERAEKLRMAQERIKQMREDKQKSEEMEEYEREKIRRLQGKQNQEMVEQIQKHDGDREKFLKKNKKKMI